MRRRQQGFDLARMDEYDGVFLLWAIGWRGEKGEDNRIANHVVDDYLWRDFKFAKDHPGRAAKC